MKKLTFKRREKGEKIEQTCFRESDAITLLLPKHNTIISQTLPAHITLWLQNACFGLFVGQNHTTITVNFITHMYIFTKNGHVLHTGPLPNSGVPSNDAAGDASMLLDADSPHYCAASDTLKSQ